MIVRFLPVLALVALAGTAIGHPVPTGAAGGSSLTYTSASLPISTVVYDHCDSTYETVAVNATINPVLGNTITLPPGDICGIRINLSSRFLLAGTGPSNSSFDLSLAVNRIDIVPDPPLYVPEDGSSGGTFLRLANTNWVTATLLGLDPYEHVTVGAGHPLHDQLRNSVRADSDCW